MRAPRLLVGANRQFEMMVDQFFAYDSSITVPLDRKPVWPYTLHYLMPHKCSGNHGVSITPDILNAIYMVFHQLADLGWADLDSRCYTILPGCTADSAKIPSA